MKYRSKKITDSIEPMKDSSRELNAIRGATNAKKAFSLIEVAAAITILALVSSSVLVVINRCMVSATDSALRMRAFEVARENMEKLLASDSVKEMVEFGSSEKYPEVQWQTTVETFYEPITNRMWVQGICSAEYTDIEGQVQTVELTHWLTNVTKKQLRQILDQERREKEWLAEQVIASEEEAAEYAGVDVETIRQWAENGMPLTKNGGYIKDGLDLYEETNGNPSPEEIQQLTLPLEDLTGPQTESQTEPGEGPREPGTSGKKYTIGGKTYTETELNQMSFQELWGLLMSSKTILENNDNN